MGPGPLSLVATAQHDTLDASGDVARPGTISRLIAGDERASVRCTIGMADGYSPGECIVGDPADAEEVWRRHSLRLALVGDVRFSSGSVAAWISTIVRTRSLDLLRSQRRRARVLEQAAAMSDEGASPALSTGSPSPDRGVEISEAQVIVRRSLADLPEPQRIVLELAYFGGLSQSEIAERLSEPLGTVKTRMRSGMEKLRTALKR